MLTALSVIIGIVCKNFFTVAVYYRFTLENLPVIFASVVFGPLTGAAVALAADAVSCLLSTNPAINPIISAGAAAVGLSAGIVARYIIPRRGIKQYAAAAVTAHIIGQVIIKSIAKYVYFGMPWYGVFIGLACSAVAVTVEIFIINALLNNKQIVKYFPEKSDK